MGFTDEILASLKEPCHRRPVMEVWTHGQIDGGSGAVTRERDAR